MLSNRRNRDSVASHATTSTCDRVFHNRAPTNIDSSTSPTTVELCDWRTSSYYHSPMKELKIKITREGRRAVVVAGGGHSTDPSPSPKPPSPPHPPLPTLSQLAPCRSGNRSVESRWVHEVNTVWVYSGWRRTCTPQFNGMTGDAAYSFRSARQCIKTLGISIYIRTFSVNVHTSVCSFLHQVLRTVACTLAC